MSGITQCWRRSSLKLALWSLSIVGAAIASWGDCAIAQIVPDSTLGQDTSIVQPNFNGASDQVIYGGAIRGANLFHSFAEFDVSHGRRALFYSPSADIENILARITGGNPSNIMGTLGTYGESQPNLFLINPNGVVFGPKASLFVGGSFFGSTASGLNLADGTHFSATAHSTTPLQSVSRPTGLQFGNTTGGIRVQGASLEVQPNKTLALVGGNVGLEGGYLKAEGGRIELGSTAQSGRVNLNQTDKGWALGYDDVQNFQDIQLSKQAVVDASGKRGGDIQLSGRRIALTDTSSIYADTLGSQNGGKISIQASELIAQDGSQISASTLGAGQGGDLSVTASESVELSGTSADGLISSGLFTQTQGTGASGDLKIATGQLLVQDGALVAANSVGLGEAGNLYVEAQSIRLDNHGAITATTASKNGGNITLQAQDLLLLPRYNNIDAKAGTASAGENGGNISISTEIISIPEPSPTLGILAFTAFSAAQVLKRKQKNS